MLAAVERDDPCFEPGSFAALLEPRQWSALEGLGRIQAFPTGSVLMYEDEPGERVMVLLEGRAKLTRACIEGQQMVVSIRGPGEIVGELPCIDALPRLVSVRALEPVQALVIDSRQFRRYLEVTPGAALALLEIMSRRLRDAVLKRTEFPASDTIGRLASRLVELADRYGEESDHGVVIGLPLSQEELGGWVGASHAGVAKALQVLRDLGWIATERRRIIVRDLDALRARAA
jgi:CRP-like cAMP-binding protein